VCDLFLFFTEGLFPKLTFEMQLDTDTSLPCMDAFLYTSETKVRYTHKRTHKHTHIHTNTHMCVYIYIDR